MWQLRSIVLWGSLNLLVEEVIKAGVKSKIYLPTKLYPQYIFTYENQSKTYRGYVFTSGNT